LSGHARDAEALVIEATFLDRDSAMASDYGHLTAAKAAQLAATGNVRQLVMTHISGRYPEEEILAEAIRIFPNSRVAADFDHVVVSWHQSVAARADGGAAGLSVLVAFPVGCRSATYEFRRQAVHVLAARPAWACSYQP
jgi:hypothetical protein